MLPYTKSEADWLAGAANDPGRRDRPNLETGPSIELIERHLAEARRLRAEFIAGAVRDLVSMLSRPLAGMHTASPSQGSVLNRLERRFADLSDRLLSILARRRILAALGPRSDRLLADIGLGPDMLSERAAAIVAEKRSRRDEGPASLERRFAALSDGVLRIRARRRLLAALGPRSERLLADIGLERNQLTERAAAIVAEKKSRRDEDKRWRQIERQVRRELMAYSDRELDDLGISRVDIPRIARSHRKTHIDLVRAGAIGAAGRVPPAANANPAPADNPASDRSA